MPGGTSQAGQTEGGLPCGELGAGGVQGVLGTRGTCPCSPLPPDGRDTPGADLLRPGAALTHSSWPLRVAGKELLSTCPWLAPTAILSTWLAETLFISGHQDRGISPTPFHTAGSAWSWANRGKTRLSPLLRGLQL